MSNFTRFIKTLNVSTSSPATDPSPFPSRSVEIPNAKAKERWEETSSKKTKQPESLPEKSTSIGQKEKERPKKTSKKTTN